MKIRTVKWKHKTSPISWIIFLITLCTVIISLVSVVFPALLIRSLGGFEDNLGINSFEAGIWAWPFLITNLIIFSTAILYHKKKLPKIVTKLINFIFNFEVSKNVAFFVMLIVIGLYITFSVNELFNGEFLPDFEFRAKGDLENFNITEVAPKEGLGKQFLLFLLNSSLQLFGNYKVIPFLSSISLLVLTYFVTVELSKKRFAGIISVLIVMQSGMFLFYDTVVVYPNFWILFYLLSLYLICKKWALSPVAFVFSVLTKGLSLAFLPMTFFFIYRAKMDMRKKIRIMISYVIMIVLGISFLSIAELNLNPDDVPFTDFDSHDFWSGFTAISVALRMDGLVLIFLLPLIVGLFVASKKGVVHADSIMFLILSMILTAPLLVAFSDHHNVPYRFVPLIVFFAIGVGLLLSKKINQSDELLSK